jgi:emfourin
VRVTFRTTGGIAAFPGRSAPRTIDVDALAPDVRASLERMLDEAHFFELPARLPPPRGSADYRSYEITVQDAGREHTVVASDPVQDPALQALIARLRELSAPRRQSS